MRLLEIFVPFVFILSGCGAGPQAAVKVEADAESAVGPLGSTVHSALLAPFSGRWIFNPEKTLAAMEKSGATKDDIELTRKAYAAMQTNPQFDGRLKFT